MAAGGGGNNNNFDDWEEEEPDRYSFDDSDRFEEDSHSSWLSDVESVTNNWRGWKKVSTTSTTTATSMNYNYSSSSGNINNPFIGSSSCSRTNFGRGYVNPDGSVMSLTEIAAREVASYIPFEVVETRPDPVPDELQLRIAFWSFPDNEEDIRLYSCLANGSSDEFTKGENLLKGRCVKDLLQIGFHLSASVHPIGSSTSSSANVNAAVPTSSSKNGQGNNQVQSVAVTFDRRKVTSCDCTCSSTSSWCCHVVAVCLHRINHPSNLCLRAPVTESLTRLDRDQLQKFAQYLIADLPRQILPIAQRLLDDLSLATSEKNVTKGAPDPTGGASIDDITSWCLDEKQLHDNIKKIVVKLSQPSPTVFPDPGYMTQTAPPAANEWGNLLRPLRSRDPEGVWNLLSIVRELFKRGDRNAIPLLEILTTEILDCDTITLWWFNTKVTLNNGGTYGLNGTNGNGNSNRLVNSSASQHSQQSCSALCDEIVTLWRLACLDPRLTGEDKNMFFIQLQEWHIKTLETVARIRSSTGNHHHNHHHNNGHGHGNNNNGNNNNGQQNFQLGPAVAIGNGNNGGPFRKTDFEIFPGFKPAIEACLLNWEDYPIPGVTDRISSIHRRWVCPCVHASTAPTVVALSGACNASTSSCTSSSNTVQRTSLSAILSNSMTSNVSSNSKQLGTSLKCNLIISSNCKINCNSLINQPSSSGTKTTTTATSVIQQQQPSTSKAPFDQQLSVTSTSSSSTVDEQSDVAACSNDGNNIVPIVSSSGQVEHSNRSSFSSEGFCETIDPQPSTSTAPDAAAVDASPMVGTPPQIANKSSSTLVISSPCSANTLNRGKVTTTSPNNSVIDPIHDIVIKRIEDPIEMLFARAEALHAHGFSREAVKLAVELSERLLESPPQLLLDVPIPPSRGKRGRRFNPASHQVSLLASNTLSKAAFLTSVLSENVETHHLAFKIGLFALELARPPASTKALEVKLSYQEQELMAALKKIPLTVVQLKELRIKAEALRDGRLKSRGDALLPLNLALYIFESLILSQPPHVTGRLDSDLLLGFQASVAALGLKANVSEADHPLLCEGTRRTRQELAIALLVQYKDDADKLEQIMDKLLDKDVHQMFKNGSNTRITTSTPSVATSASTTTTPVKVSNVVEVPKEDVLQESGSLSASNSDQSLESKDTITKSASVDVILPPTSLDIVPVAGPSKASPLTAEEESSCWEKSYKDWQAKFRCTNLKSVDKKHSKGMAAIDSSAPETTSSDNSPTVIRRALWIRAPGNNCPPTGPPSDSGSSGESSSDSFSGSSSSANKLVAEAETSSADKVLAEGEKSEPSSPEKDLAGMIADRLAAVATLNEEPSSPSCLTVPSTPPKVPNSSPNFEPSSPNVTSSPPSRSSPLATVPIPNVSTPQVIVPQSQQPCPPLTPQNSLTNVSIMSTPPHHGSSSLINSNSKSSSRFKNKRPYPSIPNQPSEALAHFMFALAGDVLKKAGGDPAASVQFMQQPAPRGPHRSLHFAAFRLGVYALGIHNAVSPNWLSRTYSTIGTWVANQAMEIGSTAFSFLIDTWTGHLTPSEVCKLANRAASSRDRNMLGVAAELALSCLPQADALNTDEIKSALIQCRDCSEVKMIQACLAIEGAAKNGSVNPEVLFEVARKWNELHEERIGERDRPIQRWRPPANVGQFGHAAGSNSNNNNNNQQQVVPNNVNPIQFNQQQQAAHQMAMFAAAAHQHHVHNNGSNSNFVPHHGHHQQPQPQMMAPPGQGYVHPYVYSHPSIMSPMMAPSNQIVPFGGQQHHMHHGQGHQQQAPPPQQGVPFQFQPFYGSGAVTATTATAAAAFVTTASAAAAAINPIHLRNMIQGAGGNNGGQGSSNFFQPNHHGGHNHHQPMIVAAAAVSQAAAIAAQSNAIRMQQQMQMAAAAAAASMVGNNGQQQGNYGHHHHHLVGAPVTAGGHFPYHQHQHVPQFMGAAVHVPPQPPVQQPVVQRHHQQPALPLPTQVSSGHGSSHDPYHQYLQRMIREVELYKRTLSMQNPSDCHLSMTPDQLGPLLSAYRVGLLGMETLSRRVHDDRPQVKYAKNPSYGDDVRWLMGIAMKLGPEYVQEFCLCLVNAVASPFILYELLESCANFLYWNPMVTPGNTSGLPSTSQHHSHHGHGGHHPTSSSSTSLQQMQHNKYKSPVIAPLISKCQQQFIGCAHHKIQHIATTDYDDFMTTVVAARAAFYLSPPPSGQQQFEELVKSLRRSKYCKKELHQMLKDF